MAEARLGAVVLAAGAGRRLGGVAKALLRDGDQTFLARIAALAAGAGVAPSDLVVVVGPPFGGEVALEARRLGATVVVNPDPARGMASSVALGFGALDGGVAAAFLWPVDHPRVAPGTLAALAARGEGVPSHGGRGGHPPLVPRRLFARLAAGTERPGGARDIVREVPRFPVDDPGVIADIDVPGDLERVCAS